MYEYIKGILTEAGPSHAVVDIGGLGYRVMIPLKSYSKLSQTGKEIIFYISTIIREDSHKLFGFLTRADRDLFERLTEVSGIGPKTALALIGHMEISDLQNAVMQENIMLISKVPGIGKKTAERLIVEMRDKFKNISATPDAPMGGTIGDALSALMNLGYPAARAQKAIQTALAGKEETPKLAQLITLALRHL